VFALGDVALGAEPLPASAQVAFQQSEYVAWNVWASATGQRPLRFRYTPLGEMMSLGRGEASVAGPEGPLAEVRVGGQLGGLARRLVYAARMPTADQRKLSLSSLAQAINKDFLAKKTPRAK